MAAGMQFFGAAKAAPDEVLTPRSPRNDGSWPLTSCGEDLVQIPYLSHEKSQEVMDILQEQQAKKNPLKMGLQTLQCKEDEKPRNETPLAGIARGLIPLLTWLPKLDRKTLVADMIAGLTVGVMVIPQSMSYADIAGLPYIYGMYSACVPTFIYAFFGQSRQLAVGPVAMVSLLVESGLRGQLSEEQCPEWYAMGGDASDTPQNEVCPEAYAQLAVLVAGLVGIIQIASRVLQLGFLVSFMGHPVTSGFTSGAAIIIGLSQLKGVLGFSIPKSQFVYKTIGYVLENISDTKLACVLLSISSLAFLIVMKKLGRKYLFVRRVAPMVPLLLCLAGTVLVWQVSSLSEEHGVKHVGDIPDGLMPLSFVHWTDWSSEDIGKVLPTAVVASLIGYMESIAIGKNLASKHGYEIEAGQELFALGLANLGGAMFCSYPVAGSFSRSAVAHTVGARSQLAGLVTAAIMVVTLMALTPLFYYLPKFVLSAIVINSVIPLVAYNEAIHLYRIKKADFVLWLVAFVGTLMLGVLVGILVAVVLSLCIVIYESARPQITILWRIPGTTIYRNVKQESCGAFIPSVFIARIGSSLYFANASFVKDQLLSLVSDIDGVNRTEYLVLEMTPVVSIDSTAAMILEDVVKDFRSRGVQVAFAMVGNRVMKTMRKAKLDKLIGKHWCLFPNVNEAVGYCLMHQKMKREHASGGKEPPQFGADDPNGSGDEAAANDSSIDTKLPHGCSSNTFSSENVRGAALTLGDEIGWSNEMHHEMTAVFIHIAEDESGVMCEITGVLRRNRVTIVRCQVEPIAAGAKHTYFCRSCRGGKLTGDDMEHIQEELAMVLKARRQRRFAEMLGSAASGEGDADLGVSEARLRALEEELAEQRRASALILEQLQLQNKRLEHMTIPVGPLHPGFKERIVGL